ncbi:uncharacterized protein [Acropora muricata]|uniref:uncharacterized protein LOC114970483 n=1 Tax=Acropora millepora TaxID=45264 RepID=UPI001CF1E18C|nr:uncharacterized protein LOC114970483 [Acropora millepora]
MASSSGGNKLGEGEREHGLIQTLDDLCKEYDHDTARQAVETMLRLANNIIKSPEEEKFRRVKTESKAFSSKVWNLPEAQQFLFIWGWTLVENSVFLSSDEDIQLVKQILLKKLNVIPSRPHTAEGSSTQPLTEREKKLQEERRRQLEKKKVEEAEKARIRAQIQADRKDIRTREMRDSKARQLGKFGGKLTKFEDIGVDLNKGGG